jgi:hypothetical protein
LVNIVPKEAKRLRLDRAALYPRLEGRGFTAEEDNLSRAASFSPLAGEGRGSRSQQSSLSR